jgi:hypothetical protein
MTSEAEPILPLARTALEQAQRVIRQLPHKESSREDYRDHVPYALDRLDNVWRMIDKDSRGKRTRTFASWWQEERNHPNRNAVKILRNVELKDNHQTTKAEMLFKGQHTLHVDEHSRMTMLREDAAEVPRRPDGGLDGGDMILQEVRWEFAVPDLEGESVQAILETVYTDLAERVLPTAERLLSEADAP